MVLAFYWAMFILSIAFLIYLFVRFKEKVSWCYLLVFSIMSLSNLGYILLFRSTVVEEAVASNILTYISSAFIPLLVILCINDLCHIKTNKIIVCLMLIFAFIDLMLPFTIGYSDIYYKNVDIAFSNGYSYLVKEYGPLHIYHTIYIITCVVITDLVLVYTAIKQKNISYRIVITFVALMFLITFTYIIERMLHSRIDFMPLAYCLGELIVIIMLNRIKYFNVSNLFTDSVNQGQAYGLIVFDLKGRFSGFNDTAVKWFPELKRLNVDKNNIYDDTKLFKTINEWKKNGSDGDSKLFEIDDKVIKARYLEIKKKGNKASFCVELSDNTQTQRYIRLMNNYNDNLKKEVDLKTENIVRMQDDIIISMASIVENRDNDTGGHIKRTSDVVKIFVEYLMEKNKYEKLDADYARCIIKAAPLHDFGKVGISDSVLNKKGRFTKEEYDEMKKHSEKGAKIVAKILSSSTDLRFKETAINVAHYHHERYDGSGYPKGLKGEEIPFEARIMALADVFDALVSKRCYKEKMSYEEAFKIIKDSLGTQFDMNLGKLFLECNDSLIDLYENYEK